MDLNQLEFMLYISICQYLLSKVKHIGAFWNVCDFIIHGCSVTSVVCIKLSFYVFKHIHVQQIVIGL